MGRAVILLIDSLGVGAASDAAHFGDAGADTVGNIARWSRQTRQRALHVPYLNSLGLGHVLKASTGMVDSGLDLNITPVGYYGYAGPVSTGKDSISGHWEITGAPVLFDWGYFEQNTQSFPPDFIDELCQRANIPGILANCHIAGTTVLDQFAQQHIETKKPICYTSVDSVFQIACHESVYGLSHLYALCEIARELLNSYNIGRVIARPFIGDEKTGFIRTGNRRDYAIPPSNNTLLDYLTEADIPVVGIGKVTDLFAGRGVSHAIKAAGTAALFDATLKEVKRAADNSLLFTNFVDFDSEFGHRRDVAGYADELEYFDRRLPELLHLLREDDFLVITGDHGCDPTWCGTDHTREHVPILCYGPKAKMGNVGQRSSFADIGQSLADYFKIDPLEYGRSFF